MYPKNNISQLVSQLVAGNYNNERDTVRASKEELVWLFLDDDGALIPLQERKRMCDRLYKSFEQSMSYYTITKLTWLAPEQRDEYKVRLRSATIDFLEIAVKCKVQMPEEYIPHLHSIWQKDAESFLSGIHKMTQQIYAAQEYNTPNNNTQKIKEIGI